MTDLPSWKDPTDPANYAPKRVRTHRHHMAHATKLHPWRELTAELHGFNSKVAVVITDLLGSMVCFWCFCLLALVSLPAVLVAAGILPASLFPQALLKVSVIGLVAWVAQTFIQLVALSVLQVSGNAQGAALAENTSTILADAEQTREHTAAILDAMNVETEGGLKDVLDAIHALRGAGTDE